ncbi:cyclodehydratase [Nonomuraea longispora]|uniref:Cyclodehydratase n=1 Tax=Nonomuraea longispora TaxID=1848320 RepID=A0A4R4N5M9_9ACTN|nr:cyclodehydratase [Nonomuraea longispora]TDC04025.1 cyclodehydratase [Nonomuraea longispora]
MAVGTALVAASTLYSAPAHAAVTTTPVSLACQADWPFDGIAFTTSQTITSNTPTSVQRLSTFTGTGTSAPYTVPTEVSGAPITELRDFTLSLQFTGPAAVTGASLSGGSNIGSGVPTVTTTTNSVTLKVPGPLTAGTTVTLPQIRINATAGNTTGTVQMKVKGTSYADPGLRVTAVVPFDPDPIIAPSGCYPSPSPVLASIAVT